MSGEMLQAKQELWHEGPNYTGDAVVLDLAANKIALIQRPCGAWALPGGFVDSGETPYDAARREAVEELALDTSEGELVFSGIVDDPRNSERSWIETSAYLFEMSSNTKLTAGDDAMSAKWQQLDNLPPLYASHDAILARALDVIASKRRLQNREQPTLRPVAGGHMDYGKYFIETPDALTFLKTHEPPNPRPEHLDYLHKEAAVMSHLRTNNYPYIPRHSYLTDARSLHMEAFAEHDNWHWRAPRTQLDVYVQDCLVAFDTLERQPLPADIHDIAASLAVHHDEGWRIISDNVFDTLTPLVAQLRPSTQATAAQLASHLPTLRTLTKTNLLPGEFAFCHHDARQANIAWHPTHGARLVDWAWADVGRAGSDATTLLIDLHKHGHDIQHYLDRVSPEHCLSMIGFWLEHASWPIREANSDVRMQQLLSAIAAYEVLEALSARGSGV